MLYVAQIYDEEVTGKYGEQNQSQKISFLLLPRSRKKPSKTPKAWHGIEDTNRKSPNTGIAEQNGTLCELPHHSGNRNRIDL